MKKIKITLSILTVVLFVTACNDDLELKNPNRQVADTYWSNEEQAVKGVTAIYNTLLIDGNYMRMTPALTDARGDDFKGDSPWLDLVQVGNFTIMPTSGPVLWMWHAYYQQVFRANQVLEYVPGIEMDENLKKRCLGQAHFLRGLAYFNLVTNFEKVPVITKVLKDPSEYNTPTSPQAEVWKQVIADFKEAQALLPVSYDNVAGIDKGQVGRATKGAATGFLGKAYLYTKDWAAAGIEFEKLINGPEVNIYSLRPNYRDNFSPFTENNSESLFEVQFASIDQVGGTVKNYGGDPIADWMQVSSIGHTYAMDGFGYSDFLPTQWIYDEYNKELTVDGKKDPRLLVAIASYEPTQNSTTVYNGIPWPHSTTAIYPRKYTHDGLGFTTESQGSTELSEINYRLLRYADVLLMYAEALNEQNKTADSYQYIQQVRNRVNLPNLAVVKPNMSQQQMRDQIAHERALELSIESIRIHDIIRWGWFYNPSKLEELKQHDSDFKTWSPGKEYLPIPQEDLGVNKNLEPNSAN